MYNIVGVGELLWDMLPAGPQLGGAPANYTVMCGRLGNHATILSRLGDDELGTKARAILTTFPVDCEAIQTDPAHETGRVTVALEDGQPTYTIHEPAAWDFMQMTPTWQHTAEQADAICYGTLAQRNPVSQATIQALLAHTRPGCKRIFDVNLRAPYYSGEVLRTGVELASVLKMNDAEVPLVAAALGLPISTSLLESAEEILANFPELELVAITRGGHGSLLANRDESIEHPGIAIKVADTIGAGDAFTAALTHYLLAGADLSVLSEAGNRWGSYVASQSGAMPEISEETRQRIQLEIES